MFLRKLKRMIGGLRKSYIWILFFVLFFFFVKLFLFLCKNYPIVLIIILVSALSEKIFEHGSHLRVIGSFIKSEVSACAEIFGEFNRVTFAENFNWCGQFFLFNTFILVTFVIGFESLPWKHSSQEIHAYIADAFHIISAG